MNQPLPYGQYDTAFDTTQMNSFTDSPPTSFFDFDAVGDFASDTATSPISPISPVLSSSSYGFPTSADWIDWDQFEHSPEPEILFKAEPFEDSPNLSCIPRRQISLSPAINPMDLACAAAFPSTVAQPGQASALLPVETGNFTLSGIPDVHLLENVCDAVEGGRQPLGTETQLQMASAKADRKRKSTSPQLKRDAPPPVRRRSLDGPKKKAHNLVEKRYRENLNDRIAELRDSVPELRYAMSRSVGYAEDEAFMDESSGQPQKLNKATILTKANEYIHHLERRNHALEASNVELQARVSSFEMMFLRRGVVM